jgi:hypothetical protein
MLQYDYAKALPAQLSMSSLTSHVSTNPFFRKVSALLGEASTKEMGVHLEEQLCQYLVDPPIAIDLNPLAWWKINESKFPDVAKMARVFLAIPGK